MKSSFAYHYCKFYHRRRKLSVIQEELSLMRRMKVDINGGARLYMGLRGGFATAPWLKL